MGEAFSALGISIPLLVAQLVNFSILLVILRFTLYRPVLRMLDERKQRIAEGLNAAEIARREAASAQANIAELRREFAAITVAAAEKVINQSLDPQAHQRVIEETLAESRFSGN